MKALDILEIVGSFGGGGTVCGARRARHAIHTETIALMYRREPIVEGGVLVNKGENLVEREEGRSQLGGRFFIIISSEVKI